MTSNLPLVNANPEDNQPAKTGIVGGLVDASMHDTEDDNIKRLGGFDTLEPGTYWRAKVNVYSDGEGDDDDQDAELDDVIDTDADAGDVSEDKKKNNKASRKPPLIAAGRVHLLMTVHMALGDFHSVELLKHPEEGGGHWHMAIEEFWRCMEPVSDAEAEAVRESERQEVFRRISEVQEEIVKTGADPMSSKGVRDAAEKALQELEEKLSREALMSDEPAAKRKANLGRIHRRAARRSEAKGNPIAVRQVVISNSLDDMINQRVTADSVAELQHEGRRRAVIAEAASTYLIKKTEQMGRIMKELTPFFEEKAQVALAKSKGAVSRVKEILKGLKSLSLYTGEGTEVMEVTTGEHAPDNCKLVLFQAKKYMDESMCLFADIDLSFDWENKGDFFKLLASDKRLRDLVLPAPRCVVSMAVTRRTVDYSHLRNPQEAYDNMMANQSVFLLVRNGENVYAVYSGAPSHEMAERLFPTTEDLARPFMGMDGTKIELSDLAYVESQDKFERMALHYKRFLILLCGLDHRERLFGGFYPESEALSFMTVDFQAKYFDFVCDDDASISIGAGLMPISQWFAEKNRHLTSGARVVVKLENLVQSSPGFIRSRGRLDLVGTKNGSGRSVCIVRREGKHHFVEFTAEWRYGKSSGDTQNFKAWLDGPDARDSKSAWLCMDAILPSEVDSYLSSRNARAAGGVSNILTLKTVRHEMALDDVAQAALRAYLRKSALEAGVLSEEGLDDKILQAINTWRAANRGAQAPALENTTDVAKILSLLFPAEKLADGLKVLAERFCASSGTAPLRLVRNGKNKLVLYSTASADEVASVQGAVAWRWVKKETVTLKKRDNALASVNSSWVWLTEAGLPVDEVTVQVWGGFEGWVNKKVEPCKPAQVVDFLAAAETVAHAGPCLAAQIQSVWTAPSLKAFELNAAGFSEASEALARRTLVSLLDTMKPDKYLSHKRAALPLGIHQKEPDGKVSFLYASCNAVSLLRWLMPAEELHPKLESVFKASGFGTYFKETLEETPMVPSFTLVGSHTPLDDICLNNVYGLFDPSFALLKTNALGGKKKGRDLFHTTKKDRKSRGPWTKEVEAKLSLNRAFERLMGKNSMNRDLFYKTAEERSKNAYYDAPWDVPGARLNAEKTELKRRYERANPAGVWLSPLVWDAERSRSVAGHHFVSKKGS